MIPLQPKNILFSKKNNNNKNLVLAVFHYQKKVFLKYTSFLRCTKYKPTTIDGVSGGVKRDIKCLG